MVTVDLSIAEIIWIVRAVSYFKDMDDDLSIEDYCDLQEIEFNLSDYLGEEDV